MLCCAHRSQHPALVAQPLARQAPARGQNVKTAAAMEIYQVADELSYITGVAGVCFAITLVVRICYIKLVLVIFIVDVISFYIMCHAAGLGSGLCAPAS